MTNGRCCWKRTSGNPAGMSGGTGWKRKPTSCPRPRVWPTTGRACPRWPMPSSPGCCARATKCCWQAPARRARALPSSSCASPSPKAGRGWAGSPAHRARYCTSIWSWTGPPACTASRTCTPPSDCPRRTCETSTSGICAARPCPWTSWPQSSSAGPRKKATPP